MLLREDDRGVLAIGQPSHAWLSGQLARAWGNEQFGALSPRDEVCLAADQHDVGWAERDIEPVFNPETQLPQTFMEVPIEDHLPLFSAGPASLLSQSRYAALLVSMHGRRLYESRDRGRMSAEGAAAVEAFLSERRSFEAELIASLGNDPAHAAHVGDHRLERNSLLIWTWDHLSLALCLGWAPDTAGGAPTAAGDADLELRRSGAAHLVEPWPFATPAVTVRCEGRRLTRGFDSERDLRDAFASAPWETLELRLERG